MATGVTPKVCFIVAVADNRVIGKGASLPWRLKSDLKRFRQRTLGNVLIMGRKTFQSIGTPLDGRLSIVLSTQMKGEDAVGADGFGVRYAASLHEALELARAWARERDKEEVFIIGGADVFARALPDCERIYLTQVHGAPEGDVFWRTPLESEGWRVTAEEARPKGPGDDYAVTDRVLEKNTY